MTMFQFDFIETLNNKIEDTISKKVNTMFPAVVLDVDDYSKQQTLDVKPLIMRKRKDGSVLDTPNIYSCPVVLPSGGSGYLSFPFSVGDIVLIGISQRDISQWMYSVGDAIPASDYDNFNLNDAIVLGGMGTASNNKQPSSEYMELVFGNSSLTISKTNDINISNENGSVSLSQDGTSELSNENGSIRLSQDGTSELSNENGSIRLTASGSVNIVNNGENMSLVTAGGDVRVFTDGAVLQVKDDGSLLMANSTSSPTGSISIDPSGVVNISGTDVVIEGSSTVDISASPTSAVTMDATGVDINRLRTAITPSIVDLVTHAHTNSGTSAPVIGPS